MLSIDQVTFSYDDTPVLDQLSLELETGSIHGILGPNGSGKTTLLNILAGRLTPDAGCVHFKEDPLTHRAIAYLETTPHFYPLITGGEYLHLFSRQNLDFNIQKWNELFELPLNQLIESYSSGMKKKLALMGIIALDRPVMLLDEPFNNLDVESNQFVARLLRLFAQKNKIVLLTSHVIEVLTSMTDYIHLLQGGQIIDAIPEQAFDAWQKTYQTKEINDKLNKAKDLL